MKIRTMIWITCLMLLCSCAINQKSFPEWLLGTWKNENSRGIIYESWTKKSNSEYHGISYSVQNEDSTVYETISIIREGNTMFYIPTVETQNNAQPVHFKATRITPEQLVFENPSHDYPQLITYRLISTDSLIAEISGEINGQERVMRFPMKRVKP